MIVWDRGTWAPAGTDDPAAAIAAGELHFDLAGEKLAGRFVLVRTGADGRGRNQWLLLHKRDDAARTGLEPRGPPGVGRESGRTNDEVRDAPDALWRSDLPAAEAEVAVDPAGRGAIAGVVHRTPGSPSPPPVRRAVGARAGAGSTARRRGPLAGAGAPGRAGRASTTRWPARRARRPLTVRDLVRYHAGGRRRCFPPAGHPVDDPTLPNGLGVAARSRRRPRRAGTGVGASVVRPTPHPPTSTAATATGRSCSTSVAAVAWVAGQRGVRAATVGVEPSTPRRHRRWVVFGIEPGAATAAERPAAGRPPASAPRWGTSA